MVNVVAIQEWKEYKDTGLKIFDFYSGFVRSNLRGTSEEAWSDGSKASDPQDSARGNLAIVEGRTQMFNDFCMKVRRILWRP